MIFNDEQQLLQEAAREFAEKELREIDAEVLESGNLPDGLYQKAAAIGLTGLSIPEEYGGTGMGAIETAIVLEEVAKVIPGFAQSLQQSIVNSALLLKNDKLAADYLPPIADGSLQVAFAFTAPDTEVGAERKPFFTRRGDEYVMSGKRLNVANCNAGLIIACGVDEDGEYRYAFVNAEKSGIGHEFYGNELGLAGSQGGIISFEDVVVPANRVVAIEKSEITGRYGAYLAAAAQALGAAEGFFAKTLEFCVNRTNAGVKLTEQTAVRNRLGELQAKLNFCRTMVYACAQWQDEYAETGDEVVYDSWAQMAESAKICVPEMLVDVQYECMKLNGGMSYHEPIYWRFMADGIGYCIADRTAGQHKAALADLMEL